MAKIVWTEESHHWLHDIYEYISEDNPTAAQKVITEIYEKVQNLKQFPQQGYLYRTELDGEIRILLYGHYRIVYQLNPNNEVIILGVFHGALDIGRYLS